MKERPILFSAPMVLALLAGTKTHTRRVAKEFAGRDDLDKILRRFPNQNGCPYGDPGDRLWVRESWAPNSGSAGGFLYRADHGSASSYHRIDLKTGVWTHAASRWRPSIHMPRTASRITLEITSVRVERLQDISDTDTIAEGIERDVRLDPAGTCHWRVYGAEQGMGTNLPGASYLSLWEQINGPGSWLLNPWVWVVEFKRVQQASSGRPSQLEDTPCSA